MRAWNRAKLLWGYVRRKPILSGLPVEYIVETTAKCNLYCPMCPRETHKQPKADMADEIFTRLVSESGRSAEHMMLIKSQRTCVSTVPAVSMVTCWLSLCVSSPISGAIMGSPPVITTCDAP